tara:strand:+ start:1408 stop:1599 length:192 start_codon:yes stop_codon:yes gene_type:complete
MKFKVKCANGNFVERFYDRQLRQSVTRVTDEQGNQIGDADYSGDKSSADWVRDVMIKDNGGKA